MRNTAAITKIKITPMRHTFFGTSGNTGGSAARFGCFCSAGAALRAFLFLPDFVEAVFANLSNLLEPAKEPVVDRNDESFQWSNYRVVNAVVLQQLVGFGRTEVNAFDLTLALKILQAVGPDVSRITHQRTTAREKHR